MGDEKIKVTWDDISRKQTSVSNVNWSMSTKFDGRPVRDGRGKIIAIAAAVVCVVICIVAGSLVLGGESRHRHNIEEVLKENQSIAASLNQESVSWEDFAGAVRRMGAIDLSGCPSDFQQAYRRYLSTCDNLVSVLQEIDDFNSVENLLVSFAVGLWGGATGDWGTPLAKFISDLESADELNSRVKQIAAEFENSYNEVLRIARKYKVDTTPYL